MDKDDKPSLLWDTAILLFALVGVYFLLKDMR